MRKKSEAQLMLEQIENVDAIIENKLIERQQWRELALSITANMDEGERVQSSGSKSKMANAVERCLDMADEILEQVEKLATKKKRATEVIEQLYSPMEYKVLHMRFIQYKDLQDIADYFGKDYEWAKATCKRGCGHVQAILNRERMSRDVPKTS